MRSYIVFNSEAAYFFNFDRIYLGFIQKADSLLCDSASLSAVLNIIGIKHKRPHGPDYMEYLLRQNKGKKIYISLG